MAEKKTSTPRTRKTKAISDAVAASGPTGGNESLSYVGRTSLTQTLTPQQCYEVNSVFRRAVNVTADNESKATLRFFSRRSNTEIEDGDVVQLFRRPNKYQSGVQFACDMAKWWKTTGEIAILPILSGKTNVTSLKLLNPSLLTAYDPQVRSLEFVKYWLYRDGRAVDGRSVQLQIQPDALVFRKNWNPYSEVRGLSEAITLVNEVTTNYYIQRYNISRFKNGVKGDIVIVFPKGTKPAVAKEFCELWQEQHSIHKDNGFRIASVIGEDTKIEELGVAAKEGEFLQLSSYTDDRIAGLVGVPASIMGFYSKTRFDTIDAELESWAENSLLPDLRIYSETYQCIVDRYFPSAVGTKKIDRPGMSKAMRAEYERAMDSADPESDIVVVFDPDSLPIMAKLNRSRVAYAKEIREALDLSASEAAEFVGLEIPTNPLRDDIWVANNRQKLTDEPATEPQNTQNTPQNSPQEAQNEDQIDSEDVDPEGDKSLLKDAKAFYRDFRKAALEAFSAGKNVEKALFTSRAKEISNDLVVQFHKDFLEIREIVKGGGDVQAVKAYFNQQSKPSVLRRLLEKA